jgi:glycerol-3-phosphate acyltransferase PlsX
VKIALDAMGGDLAPKATVEGAVAAARDFKIEVVLVGDRGVIDGELAAAKASGLPISIVHASEAVAMEESPVESLSKLNSSMHVGYEMLKRGEVDGFASAGNSGAMMTAAMAILGTLPGVDRPAIGSLVPSSGDHVLLIDAGANVEVKPHNLVQFAVMGTAYARRVRRILRPRVGILSNGEEDSKGTDLTRAAAATLRAMTPEINYIGYVEGRDINRGNVDVVVTDGFTGNVALKTMEGFASFMMGNLREVFGGGFRGRLAYLLARKRLGAMRQRFDPSEYGGAPLLGVSGVAIISHGSSTGHAIRNAIRTCADESLVRQVNAEIVELLRKIPVEVALPAKPAGKGIRALFARMRGRLHRRETAEHREAHAPETAKKPVLPAAVLAADPSGEARAPDEPRRGTGPIGTGPLSSYANGAAPSEPAKDGRGAQSQTHPPEKSPHAEDDPAGPPKR